MSGESALAIPSKIGRPPPPTSNALALVGAGGAAKSASTELALATHANVMSNRADLAADSQKLVKGPVTHSLASVHAVAGEMSAQEVANMCSHGSTNAYADRCMEEARKPSKANVLTVAVRGAGAAGADKLAVKTVKSDEVKVESTRPEFEKVWNRYSSAAGSNSCSQPLYFRGRRIEMARLEKMDKDYEAMQEAMAFQAKREAAIEADEAREEAKRSKRQKKKEAKAKGKQLAKEADGINKFEGGNFLELMMKMDPKEMEEEARKAKEAAVAARKEAMAVKASTVSAAQMSSADNVTIRDYDDF
eukprot:TRINITY_DN78159_c0_g1_i1.p1 TRINITY_DN78159_c0_g1~~TRINITY_DN78159_c0_g1_i1.p1  ORF type:complete len:305 (+),score=95.14 TRINITY_DN78159_c0_g1_i1:93-1007(+)